MTPAAVTSAGPPPETVLVVGSGLIGTSIGLALQAAGVAVDLADADTATANAAAAMGAGTAVAWPGEGAPAHSRRWDLAVVAVPPSVVAEVADSLLRSGVARTVVHVASVQTRPLLELQSRSAPLDRLVGTHPMAGRERGGPAGASAALFQDRSWVLCPSGSAVDAVAMATRLIELCGGRPVTLAPEAHDAAVAEVSALPQLLSSALAAGLLELDDSALGIAGTGLRDLTRLAASQPELWAEIAAANGPAVVGALQRLTERLRALLSDGGTEVDPDAVRRLIAAGQLGHRRLGGKHGSSRPQHWAGVLVIIGDRPGALLEVLTVCRDAAVNVEDLSVEHATGAPSGLLQLFVEPSAADRLASALADAGLAVAGRSAPHE